MALLYGFSILYVLTGLLAYTLNAAQVFLIALVAYMVDKFIFKSSRRFFTVLATIIVLLGFVAYVLYRYEQLEFVRLAFVEFFTVYYYSIVVATVSIDLFHQVMVIVALGLLLMAPLERFIRVNKHNYIYLVCFTIVLVVAGYLSRSMGSSKDREAFMILSATMILYYFYDLYYRYTDFRRKFLPFFTTILLFVLVIVGGARGLYLVDPRPLTELKQRTSFTLSEDVETETPIYDKLSYFRDDTFVVADSFEYDYIEILRIRSEYVNYLKAETYELYYDGEWRKSKDLPYMANDGDSIEDSDAYETVDYQSYYAIEDVRVVVKNFNTNVLLVNNYGVVDPVFYDNLRVMNDNRRGTYFSNERLMDNYVYEFGALIPNYGGKALDNLIRAHSNEPLPVELDQLRGPLTQRYDPVQDLAIEITSGIENKYDQALAIEKYLTENYTYNIEPPVAPDGVEPIIHFLFESKEGFCQQFTTAYILMLRSIDIPARYAVGFYVGERDLEEDIDYDQVFEEGFIEEGIYSVYDYNAHTWPEVYFPEVGWIMFEPTPGRYYKTEELDYNQYDYELALEEQALGGGPIFKMVNVYYAMTLVGGFGLIFLLYLLIRKRRQLKGQSPNEKMFVIHELIRTYLRRAGLKKDGAETPREYALKADDYLFDIKDDTMTDLMVDYENVLYGNGNITDQSLLEHLNYLKAIQKVMRPRLLKVQRLHLWLLIYFRLKV